MFHLCKVHRCMMKYLPNNYFFLICTEYELNDLLHRLHKFYLKTHDKSIRWIEKWLDFIYTIIMYQESHRFRQWSYFVIKSHDFQKKVHKSWGKLSANGTEFISDFWICLQPLEFFTDNTCMCTINVKYIKLEVWCFITFSKIKILICENYKI